MLALLRKAKEKKKAEESKDDSTKWRLKKPFVNHCLLCFKPNMVDFTFEGSEIIQMNLVLDTKEIVVNAVELVITKAMWEEDVTLNRQEPLEIRMEYGVLKLIFEPPLLPQTGCLRLNFKGNMTDKIMKGFFAYDPISPQPHKEEDLSEGEGKGPGQQQEKKELNLMTVFEPCEARRCFPCWDDPSVKVTYDLILVVPKDTIVLGPTVIKATYRHRRDPLLEVVEFKRTPMLSPHSLGLVYGHFEFVEAKTTDDEVLIRVYTPSGKKVEGEFALSLACKAIPFLRGYFGASLNIQKLDLVALPDYATTPVSSWGLIFFRSSEILVEPSTALLDIMWIALIICHELTKLWFGHLATFDWWSHQWLSNGVASFVKYIFVHQMFPEMEVWSHFVTNNYQRALKMDAGYTSRPIEVQVIQPYEVEEAFDEICIFKSPSLLRMVHRFVGDAPFRKGLQMFLLRYQYANATTMDFWKCMQEATSKPLGTMMTNWSQLRGYPMINVTIKQDSRNRILKMTQERFSHDPGHRDPKGQSPVFSIPLSFSTRNRPNESVLDIVMDTKALSVTIHDVSKTDWVKVNPGSVGFFRVKYPHEMMSTIIYAIREKSLPPLDRLNVLDDSFAFLLAGYSSTVELLSLLEAFVEDDDYSVWITISNIFDRCLQVFEQVGKAESFQSFGRFIYQQIYAKLGWRGYDEESILQKFLRPLIIRMMGKFSHPEVVERCTKLFEGQFGEDPVPVPVDFRYAVYKTVVAHGDENLIKRFIRLYRDCEPGEEKDKLACALGACRQPSQIAHVLEFSISDEVRRAHAMLIISAITKSKVGKEQTWTFIKENFALFKTTYSANQFGRLLQTVLENFAVESITSEINEFFKLNLLPGTEKTLQKICDSIKLNEHWLKREKNLTALQDYLESMH